MQYSAQNRDTNTAVNCTTYEYNNADQITKILMPPTKTTGNLTTNTYDSEIGRTLIIREYYWEGGLLKSETTYNETDHSNWVQQTTYTYHRDGSINTQITESKNLNTNVSNINTVTNKDVIVNVDGTYCTPDFRIIF